MKRILTTILSILCLASCNNEVTENKNNAEEAFTRSVAWGSLSIKLPIIEGMQECYSEPKIAAFADQFEAQGNKILAFYLNDKTYAQKQHLGNMIFDDYFKLYATEELKNGTAKPEEMDEIFDLIKSGFISKNWSDITDGLSKANIEIGKPYLMESYKLNERTRTMISVSKFSVDDETKNICTAMNALLIKDKLIWLAYYRHYSNKQTIAELKAKNNQIIQAILAVN